METILIEDQYKNIVDSIYKRLNPFYIMETILILSDTMQGKVRAEEES